MREFFVNADFDISLRPRRAKDAIDGKGRQASEMVHHSLLWGVEGDVVVASGGTESVFSAYLERAGLEAPATVAAPSRTADARLVPFGWNEEAASVNRSYVRPSIHPPLEVVKRVNGRRYAAQLEKELFDSEETLGAFDSEEEVRACISSQPRDEGWLLKSEHGNSGLGNRRLRTSELNRSDGEVVRRLLAEDECVLVERWRHRVLDISTVYEIERDGTVKDLFSYEAINTADGAFIGSIFDNGGEALEPWRDAIAEVAIKVAGRLFVDGYFGPVCLDHFVWSNGNDLCLRPLADLNARLQVSAPILRLWRGWSRDRVVYWRLFSARKLRLPTDYARLEEALGGDAFAATTRRGVLVTSPFRVAGTRLRRIGVLLVGGRRAEVDEMDRMLRGRFEG